MQISLEEGRKALEVHVTERGVALRRKYGTHIQAKDLPEILKDPDYVRFPTRIEFNTEKLEPGMFAVAERVGESASEGYVIWVHDFFKVNTSFLPAVVLYHVVAVNYGDFSTFNEAEVFGSEALGMEQEEYYQLLCGIMDRIQTLKGIV